MRLGSILGEQDEPDLPEDWPPYAYVPGMGDVYGYGFDPEPYYRRIAPTLRPGEYMTWAVTIVRPLPDDPAYETDSDVSEYVRALRQAGYETHSCCSGTPHDHPLLADENDLPHGYLAFSTGDPRIRRVVLAAQSLGLPAVHVGETDDHDDIVRIDLTIEDWPALVRALLADTARPPLPSG